MLCPYNCLPAAKTAKIKREAEMKMKLQPTIISTHKHVVALINSLGQQIIILYSLTVLSSSSYFVAQPRSTPMSGSTNTGTALVERIVTNRIDVYPKRDGTIS